jgi:tetratricopeptide (TPR) repeat protein
MIALNPTNAGNYHWRGVIKAEAKDYQGAITDLTKAITLKKKQGLPPNIHSYTARAGAYTDLRKYTLALNDLTYALTLDPEDAVAYSNRGSIRWSLGDLSGALADYKKADSLKPNTPIVLGNIGETLNAIAVSKANRRDFSGACDYFNEAVLYFNQAKEIAIDTGDTPTYQLIMGSLKTIGSSRAHAGCY